MIPFPIPTAFESLRFHGILGPGPVNGYHKIELAATCLSASLTVGRLDVAVSGRDWRAGNRWGPPLRRAQPAVPIGGQRI